MNKKLETLEEYEEEISDIEIKHQPEEKPIKTKKALTDKQKENWEKCKLIREQRRQERKELLEAYNKKMEDDLNKKVLKRATALKNKQIKELTNKVLKEELEPEFKIKEEKDLEPMKNSFKKPISNPRNQESNPKILNHPSFHWC